MFTNGQINLDELQKFVPEIQAGIEKAKQANLDARVKLVEKISDTKQKLNNELPRLVLKENDAFKEFAAAEAETAKKQQTHYAAACEKRRFVAMREREIEQLESELRGGCDPLLDEAIEYFRAALEKSRREDRVQTVETPKAAPSGRGLYYLVESNKSALCEKHNYILSAIRQLQEMKLEPEFDELAVEALKAGIPSAEIYTEVK